MLNPDTVVAAAAGVVVLSTAALHWSAARSIRRAVDNVITYQSARYRAVRNAVGVARRPVVPLPPDPPGWARDTTMAMPPVPAPRGGLRGTGPRPPREA